MVTVSLRKNVAKVCVVVNEKEEGKKRRGQDMGKIVQAEGSATRDAGEQDLKKEKWDQESVLVLVGRGR